MLELIMVILLKQQEKMMRDQNRVIESLREMQGHCRHHIKKLEVVLGES